MSWNWGGENVPETREIRDILGQGWVVNSMPACDRKLPTRTSAFPGSILRDKLSFSTPADPRKSACGFSENFLPGGMFRKTRGGDELRQRGAILAESCVRILFGYAACSILWRVVGTGPLFDRIGVKERGSI
jgi:hypothetical protein